MSAIRTRVLILGTLVLILLAGAYFRFTGLDWDQGQHLHPDERVLTEVLSSLSRPSSFHEYFNTAISHWNPHNMGYDYFPYGTLPIFIIRFIGEVLDRTGYGEIYLLGRALSGMFDLLTVLLLFFLARQLYDTRVALLASALSAAAVLQIQQSHFMTVDSFATTFAMLTLLLAVMVSEDGKLWQYLLTGLALGMSVASRINLAIFAPVVVVAAGLQIRRRFGEVQEPEFRSKVIRRNAVGLIVAAFACLVAFRIFQPYAFDGPGLFGIHLNRAWLDDMRTAYELNSGEIDYPPSHQWTNRPAYLFPWSHMVLWGLGLPLGLAGWAGWVLASRQIILSRRSQHVLPVVWVLVGFGYHGRQFVKVMRYFLPIYPILAMLAAFLLVWLWDRVRAGERRETGRQGDKETGRGGEGERGSVPLSPCPLVPLSPLLPLSLSPLLSGALALLVVAGTYLWSFAFTRIYTRPVTRVVASRWIYDHVPTAATVHYESSGGTAGQTQVSIPLERSAFTGDGFIVESGASPYRMIFAPVADGRLGTVKLRQIEELEHDPQPETIEVSLTSDVAGQYVIATRQTDVHLEQTSGPHAVSFSGVPVRADQLYYVLLRVIDGGPIEVAEREMGYVTYWTDEGLEVEMLRSGDVLQTVRRGVVYDDNGGRITSAFRLYQPAVVRSITMNYLLDPVADPEPESFQVAIASDADGRQILASAQVTAHMEGTDNPRGEAYTFELPAVELEADREYFLITQVVDGAPVQAWSTVIANEHWDDSIPLPVDGRDSGIYHGFKMEHYQDDNPEKLDELVAWLDQADYVMLTSNRLFGSIPRLPMRYPITTEYYDLLFRGELGFELEETFTSYPNIGPIEIPDQSAEESFTVYDHPKVWVFRKTKDFSPTKIRAMLADEAQGPSLRLRPLDAAKAPTGLFLPPDQWARQQQAGTWSAVFDRGSLVNRSAPLTILVWLLTVEAIGVVAFPAAYVAFGRLAHRGYLVSKVLGLLLLAWLAWYVSSLTPVPYARWTIVLALGGVALCSAVIVRRRVREIRAFIRANIRPLIIGEALFLITFLAFTAIRMNNPDLWHAAWGGEKPMDFAYLSAVIKSTTFPPYDPWFAGGYMNYYYFGFVIVGTLIKLLGIVPATAYNLAVPTLFALTFVGAFVIVYNLVEGSTTTEAEEVTGRPNMVLAGLVGALFVAVAGNLEESRIVLEALRNLGGLSSWSAIPGLGTLFNILQGLAKVVRGQPPGIPNDQWFWNASRVMGAGEINEFPYFTFLYGDLHAHMIALPVTLLALAMAVHLIRDVRYRDRLADLGISLSGPPGILERIDGREFFSLALWGLIIGALRAINTWDFPTYLLVAGGTLVMREWWWRRRFDRQLVWAIGWRFALVVIASRVFLWPFITNYATAYDRLELWNGERTHLGDYLTIHGFFLFMIGTFLIVEALRWRHERGRGLMAEGSEWSRQIPHAAGLLTILALVLVYFRLWVFLLTVLLAGLGMVLLLRREMELERRLIAFLFLLGLALTLAVDVVVLKGDVGRMNTVFKFYIQVWVLWGVVAAVCLAWLWPTIRHWEGAVGQGWWCAFVALCVAVLLYPLLATPAKIRERFDQTTGLELDGMAYMDAAVIDDQGQALQLRYDQQAVQWLQENVPGTPVILEANTPPHGWGARISTYTGLPTVIGWDWHQRQQRSILPGSVIDRRLEDVKTIYDTPHPQRALRLLREYDVSFVYVGPLERAHYDPGGLAKFDHMVQDGTLAVVYENPEVRIYQLRQSTRPPEVGEAPGLPAGFAVW